MSYENLKNLLAQESNCVIEIQLLNVLTDVLKSYIDINGEANVCTVWYPLSIFTEIMMKIACTPLLMAVKCKNKAVVQALLDDGADPCKAQNNYITPLMEAVHQESTEIVELLLQHGADPTIPTAFVYAIKHDRLPFINYLLDLLVQKGDHSAINSGLIPAAGKDHHKQLVTKLLSVGADPNYKNEDGTTLLEVYATNGDVKMVESLLKAGANINDATSTGHTPLALAASLSNVELALSLIELGADVRLAEEDVRDFALRNVDFAFHLETVMDSEVLFNWAGPD